MAYHAGILGYCGRIPDDPRPHSHQYGYLCGISLFIIKYRSNQTVQGIFRAIRPVVVGLIASAVLVMATPENFVDYRSYLLFSLAFLAAYFYKVHPILLMFLGGVAGFLMY